MLCNSSRFLLLKEKTGMVIIEVEFVTGWEAADPDSLVNLKEIQRVDTEKEENKVQHENSLIFYLTFICLFAGSVVF